MRSLTDKARSVAHAWSVGPVRRGVLATVLITLGCFTPAYLPQASPFWPALRWLHLGGLFGKALGTLLVLGGIGLLVDAWFRLRPQRQVEVPDGKDWTQRPNPVQAYHHVRHWAVLLLWGAPLLLAPPVLSHDAYSYAAQGWLVHNGINPYEQGPGVLPGAFADQVAWVWRFTPAPYGPLSLQLQHLLVDLSGFTPYLASVFMRIPAIIGVGLIGYFLPRLATMLRVSPAMTAWFSILNPLLVIDFIGGAHNDSLMIGLVIVALWIARRWSTGWPLAALLVGAAAAIKQPALLAAYALPLFHYPWRSRPGRRIDAGVTMDVLGRAVLSCGLAIGSFCGISVLTGLGFGWLNAVNVPGLALTVSPMTIIGVGMSMLFGLVGWDLGAARALTWARTAGLLASAGLIGFWALTVARRRPVTFLAWSYLAVALLSPALHSWYVLWGGLLLPLTRPGRRVTAMAILITIVLLAYAAINLSNRNGLVAFGIVALGLYVLQSRRHVWTNDREAIDA